MRKTLIILFLSVAFIARAQDTISFKVGSRMVLVNSGGSIIIDSIVPPNIVGNFSFPLSGTTGDTLTTSAGVYRKSDSSLIRTLWSGQPLPVYLSYVTYWDGKNDIGVSVVDRDSFFVRVVANKIQAIWQGAYVGNTGTPISGVSKFRSFETPRGIAVVGNMGYWANGYNEAHSAQAAISTTTPSNGMVLLDGTDAIGQSSDYVCSDGTNLYWGGYNIYIVGGSRETFVFGQNINTLAQMTFTNGVSQSIGVAYTYPSVISYVHDANGLITGMAVQQTGNKLFVSRTGLNQLQVLDKATGVVLQTLTITGVSKLSIDGSDNLWVVHNNIVEKYIVNSDGTLSNSGITVTGLTNIGAIAVNSSKLAVCDINSQIVRFYNQSTGVQTGTLGSGISYIADATVLDNKFYWKDRRQNSFITYLAFLSDGSLYVGDPENRRTQHFASNGSFIESIGWLNANYNLSVNQSSPTRIFSDFLEFEIDYSKTLAANNGSWKLKKNWKGTFTNAYDQDARMQNVVTLSAHTYGMLKGEGQQYYPVELADTLRYIPGIEWGQRTYMDKDGSIITNPEGAAIGIQSHVYRYALNSIDVNGNPQWSTTAQLIATTPTLSATDPLPNYVSMASDGVVFFNNSGMDSYDNRDAHLGFIPFGNTRYTYKTAFGTSRNYDGEFPKGGAFDNGNGGNLEGAGSQAWEHLGNIYWGFHGEFWKQSQCNKFNVVDKATGLFLMQFGTENSDWIYEVAPPEVEGNTKAFGLVTVNGHTYNYHNGESYGLHRWEITGLNTKQVIIATPSPNAVTQIEEGIDLLEGIDWGMTTLPNNYHGWTRSPISDVGNLNIDHSLSVIGNRSFDRNRHPDLLLSFRQLGSGHFQRDLEVVNNTLIPNSNANLSSWKLKGILNYQGNDANETNYERYGILAILDSTMKSICWFTWYRPASGGDKLILGDGNTNEGLLHQFTITTGHDINLIRQATNHNTEFELTCVNGVFTVKYGQYTGTRSTVKEAGANWRNPKYLYWDVGTANSASNSTRILDIQGKLRFINH